MYYFLLISQQSKNDCVLLRKLIHFTISGISKCGEKIITCSNMLVLDLSEGSYGEVRDHFLDCLCKSHFTSHAEDLSRALEIKADKASVNKPMQKFTG